MLKYSEASPCCMVVALLYLRRFQERFPSLVLTSRTLQRLLLVAAMTATKFLEDVSLSNDAWAEIGNLPLAELNSLEINFLFGIEFDLRVSSEEYARLADELRYPACAHLVGDQLQSPTEGTRPVKETTRGPQISTALATSASRIADSESLCLAHLPVEKRCSCEAMNLHTARAAAPLCMEVVEVATAITRAGRMGLLKLLPFLRRAASTG
jgi:hypothetical protein